MKRRHTLVGFGQSIPQFDVETAGRGEFRMYDTGTGMGTGTKIPMMVPVAVC